MKKLVSVLLLSVVALTINAQEKDPVLLTVGGVEVKLSEFSAIFNKNKTEEKVTEESLNEYLDLYVKFKLKVREAEELGYDTLTDFKNELANYRAQLAKPYLTDKDVTESLIKEAYERMKYDVKASHILIKLDASSFDNDTVSAYKRIMAVRKRVMAGEDFEKVAKEVSEDPSAQKNEGSLGYFSAMHMVYPFESAAYNTKVGEVSQPIRTKFGYHLVKVYDKREARGTIRTAHIMVKHPKKDESDTTKTKEIESAEKKKIYEIYEKLKAGADFADLARQFSDDKRSAKKGGELKEFNAGKMVAEFEEAAFALDADGDFSEPFQTRFGWHIVKRISLKKLEDYESVYNNLKQRVSRDSRSSKSKKAMIVKIKKENDFKENLKERDDFYNLITAEEIKKREWDINKAKGYDKVMFGFYAKDGDKLEYTQTDFANLIVKQKIKDPKKEISIKSRINLLYKQQVYQNAIKFIDGRLEKTNQEFRLLIKEYRDGILLFDLTDEKVWSKAVKDTVGLEAYYEENKSNYMWPERVDVTLYKCGNATIADDVTKIIKKKEKKGYTNEQILEIINTDSQLSLSIEEGKFSKGQDEVVDKVTWEKGTMQKVVVGDGVTIVVVNEVLAPKPKAIDEIRGLITSDYQNYLEKEWVEELKGKYDVKVNKEVLKLVK